MTIGERIKQQRIRNNMTLEDVSKYAKVSRQTIQKYESGIISNIPSDKIEAVAKALCVTPSYLMGWEDEGSSSKPQENTISLIGRDGTKIIKTYSDEQMETIRRLLDAIPSEDVDL